MVFLLMIFAHIVDDFYLQGILAKLKQKSWWIENAPAPKYSRDYIPALIIHGLSWAIMIALPLWFFTETPETFLIPAILVNAVIHSAVDHLKANKKITNLFQDQIIHFVQIGITFFVGWLVS